MSRIAVVEMGAWAVALVAAAYFLNGNVSLIVVVVAVSLRLGAASARRWREGLAGLPPGTDPNTGGPVHPNPPVQRDAELDHLK